VLDTTTDFRVISL